MKLKIPSILKEVSYSVNERIGNPFWLTFILVFAVANWENVLTLFYIGEFQSITDRIDEIRKMDFILWKSIGWSFLYVILFYIIQIIGQSMTVFFKDRVQPHLTDSISSKRIADKKKLNELRELNSQLQKDKSEAQDNLAKIRAEMDSASMEHESRVNELQNKIDQTDKNFQKISGDLQNALNEKNAMEKERNKAKALLDSSRKDTKVHNQKPVSLMEIVFKELMEWMGEVASMAEFQNYYEAVSKVIEGHGGFGNLKRNFEKKLFEDRLRKFLEDEGLNDVKGYKTFAHAIAIEIEKFIGGISENPADSL